MAREEHDREDLMAEATALVERVELTVAGFPEPIVIGFRRDGCASFYFGPDPAWHFNTRQELRRGYVNNALYKADRGRLTVLRRERTTNEVQLVSRHLTEPEHMLLVDALGESLATVKTQLASNKYRTGRQVPAGDSLVPRIVAWLNNLAIPISVAASPHAR